MHINSPISERYRLVGFKQLEELALNLHWSWNHATDWIWEFLDKPLWEETHNPWIVLHSVSLSKIKELLTDKIHKAKIKKLVKERQLASASAKWFQNNYPQTTLNAVAYFSMEYMLTEALPIYSGGLGNVAGDHLKAASDLGVPVIGIGLLYQQGYFRQVFDRHGAQEALYPFNDPGQLPIVPLRQNDGQCLRLKMQLPGYSIWLRTWHVRVGDTNLFLLDSNDMANYPAHRGITTELYGGGSELRLKQELLLGIAGWQLLEHLGKTPLVCHLNEGHAAFAVLERIKSYMLKYNVDFEVALAATRAGNLFTTHTAVPAGFDSYTPELLEKYLGQYISQNFGISFDRFLALGRQNPEDRTEKFNMAFFAMRGCGAVNAVSKIHGEVSKHLFAPLFPRWPLSEIPIGSITNGVHMPTWDAPSADQLWTKACGKERWLDVSEQHEKHIEQLSNASIWEMRQENRRRLIAYVACRLASQLAVEGASLADIEKAKHKLNPNTLILGFARRFATYKRPNLLLTDPERLLRILNHSKMPVQLIIAGKAHPEDQAGKELIQAWNHFIARADVSSVVFLSDYDVLLAERLTQGVDVWLNTPRRPWEACGTSGMKLLVNGGLNLSILDGWWAEAYKPTLGWSIGDGCSLSDAQEAEMLYDILENQVIPEFYARDAAHIPTKWVDRIRASMSALTAYFSSNRSLREYVEKYYLSLANGYEARSYENAKMAKELVRQQASLKQAWKTLSFGALQVKQVDDTYHFEIPLYMPGLDEMLINVELYADQSALQEPFTVKMLKIGQLSDGHSLLFQASAPATRPASDYTPRVIAAIPTLAQPLEVTEILWQK